MLVDQTWEWMKKRYSRIMKNQQLQGEKGEKEGTEEEEDMDGIEIEDGEETSRWEVEDIKEEVEELHTAYILADF